MNTTQHSRRHFLHSALGVSAGLAVAGPHAFAEGAPPSLRLGTLVPRGSSYFIELQKLGEQWRKITGGKTSLKIYPDGSMGGEAEMVRRMHAGQLQAGLFTAVGLCLLEPAISGLQNMPMMFRDLDDVDFVNEKMREMLAKKLEAKGFVVLFWADAGWVRFFSKQPVLAPDDLKRQKIFCWAGDPDQFKLMRDLGMQPVAIEPNDILPGLRTGMIEAVPMPPFVALASQVDTSASHMLMLNYAPLVGAAVIDKKAWDKFSSSEQAEMLQAADVAGRIIKAQSRKEADESIKAMQKRGLSVHLPSPAQIHEWEQLLQKAYPTIRGKIVPADIFDEVVKLLEERHHGLAAKP